MINNSFQSAPGAYSPEKCIVDSPVAFTMNGRPHSEKPNQTPG